MKKLLSTLAAGLLCLPFAATADLSANDLPADTVWYVHADLAEMRATGSGSQLYSWLQDEVIVEVNDELKVDLNKELDRMTAFSSDGSQIVAILEGAISPDLRDKIIAVLTLEGDAELRRYGSLNYYKAGDEDSSTRINGDSEIKHSMFITFDVPNKILVASEEEQLKALIDDKGVVRGVGSHSDALFVLSADKDFVQAGMRTSMLDDDGEGWDSNILRNTRQAALLIADKDGMLALSAKLITEDEQMTRSLASIVGGIIALQAFSSELEPEVAELLRNTRVDTDGNELSISTVVDPAMVVRTLGE